MDKQHWGKYRAEVIDVNDPQKLGRIRVKCPKLLGDRLSNWAYSCFPPGIFSPVVKGELVWIEFEDGDIDKPIWTGIFATKSYMQRFKSVPTDLTITLDGSYMQMSKSTGDLTIKSIGVIICQEQLG